MYKKKPEQNQALKNKLVRVTGFEPARRKALDPKSSASANFATPAYEKIIIKLWQAQLDLNQRSGSQSPLPYPLAMGLNFMGRPMGVEPTNVGTTTRCVNRFATTARS